MNDYTKAWLELYGNNKPRLTPYCNDDRILMTGALYTIGVRDQDNHRECLKRFTRTFGGDQ